SLPEFFWLVLVIAITPAICEETFFRGYVQRTMERTVKWKSVLIVGVVFGLFHLQPLGLISLSILGMVFGYFAYRSKSLLPSMAAHFTNNFVVILFSFIEAKSQVDRSTMEQISLSWVIATFAIGVIILYTFQKITDRNFSEEYAPTVVE
ncbi:MAG: CPBP family intramembrane metalloprotease, partial [Ignavibacteriales bacterium]|nr:CPBP family intramembrane metalloprotease [Ignavibacteriales bacterium]